MCVAFRHNIASLPANFIFIKCRINGAVLDTLHRAGEVVRVIVPVVVLVIMPSWLHVTLLDTQQTKQKKKQAPTEEVRVTPEAAATVEEERRYQYYYLKQKK